jgi:polysaccharide deacetylase family protein (PEP-CTERM system associated)
MRNVISVDVEEYFHPTELGITDAPRWRELPSRIIPETRSVLKLLARHQIKGTFFILGWVAEHYPDLIGEIADGGHEIGCHSYAHRLVYNLSPGEFEKDTERAVNVILAACGIRPRAYRAPSYSITRDSLWALEILVKCGFTHDSSIYPVVHDRYGIPGFGRHGAVLETPSGPIMEVPIATVRLSERNVAPVGGGGYLRLLPYCYTAAGIRRINEENQPACIYFHPWELDCDQPRLAAGFISRLRTYTGLRTMASKLDRLLSEFEFSSVMDVHPEATAPVQAQVGVV